MLLYLNGPFDKCRCSARWHIAESTFGPSGGLWLHYYSSIYFVRDL